MQQSYGMELIHGETTKDWQKLYESFFFAGEKLYES
jgi:hypothetical protein